MSDLSGGPDPRFDVDARPRVSAPGSPLLTVLGAVAVVGLGLVVFLQLNASREARTAQEAQAKAAAEQAAADRRAQDARTAAPAVLPPAPPSVTEIVPLPPPPSPPPAMLLPDPPRDTGPSPEELARLKAPALIVDLGEYAAPGGSGSEPAGGARLGGLPMGGASPTLPVQAGKGSADENFAEKLGVGANGAPVKARAMGDRSLTIAEGTVIPAVLETAINSDLPGYVRALVSRDVRSFDGSTVLAPRGSRLIGQYRAGVALGHSRAFVIWTRLIRPDGASVELAAPGADALGRGGLDGDVDRHFLRRFGGAMLLSLISLGVEAISASETRVIIAATQSGGDAASVALSKEIDIPPTVSVPQGAPIRVFVTRDLDFTAVGGKP